MKRDYKGYRTRSIAFTPDEIATLYALCDTARYGKLGREERDWLRDLSDRIETEHRDIANRVLTESGRPPVGRRVRGGVVFPGE